MNFGLKNSLASQLAFHHFGLFSLQMESTAQLLTSLGYSVMPSVVDPLQNMRLCMAVHSAFPSVEIISPVNSSDEAGSVVKNMKQGVYHVCYEVENLAETLEMLSADRRVVTVSEPKPAVLFGGRPVSFYYVQDFGLIELLEPLPKAG